jgi:hypothetical protein
MKHSFQSLDELLHTVRRTENPNAEDRRAVRRSLSALFATAVTTSTAVASAATKTALVSTMLWPFVTGAVVGGAVIVTTAVAYRPGLFAGTAPPSTGNAVRPAAAPRAEPPVAPTELTPPGELPSAMPAPPSEQRAPEAQPMVESRTRQPARESLRLAPAQTSTPAGVVSETPGVKPQSAQSLEAESRALAEAQRALRDHDAEWALNMLAQQDRVFADGKLAEERAAARVLALCAAGRLDEGRAAAERFQRQYPGSMLTERVRQACER